MEDPISVLPDDAPRHERLRLGLRARGITQKEVATARGCNQIHLTRVLGGKRTSEPLLDFVEDYIRRHDEEVTAT